MQTKKHLCHLSRRFVCLMLASVMILSTILTGCGSITGHALEDDDHDHSGEAALDVESNAAELVSSETTSSRDILSGSLNDSLANEAAVISDDYWENDIPADEESAREAYMAYQDGEEYTGELGSDTGSASDLEISVEEKKFDENGLRQTSHNLTVLYTLVDESALTVDSIEDMWAFNVDAFKSNFTTYVPIYEVKGYNDCYVALVDFSKVNGLDGRVVTVEYSSHTEDNVMVENDNVVTDLENGIVYLPKAQYFTADGTEIGWDLKAQAMVAIDFSSTSQVKKDARGNILTDVSVEVDNAAGIDTNLTTGTYEMMGYEFVILDIVNPADGNSISADDMEVYVNGSVTPEPADNIKYNPETGNLTINGFALTISDVKVVFPKVGFFASIANFFSGDSASAATVSDATIKKINDGVPAIYNVDTGEDLRPYIEIDKLVVGDILAYQSEMEHAATGDRTEFEKQIPMILERSESSDVARSDWYWFSVGNMNFDYNHVVGEITQRQSAWAFIIEAPFYSAKKSVGNPVIYRPGDGDNSRAGLQIYFGEREEWMWTNKDDTANTAVTYLGQCAHTTSSTYHGTSFGTGNSGTAEGNPNVKVNYSCPNCSDCKNCDITKCTGKDPVTGSCCDDETYDDGCGACGTKDYECTKCDDGDCDKNRCGNDCTDCGRKVMIYDCEKCATGKCTDCRDGVCADCGKGCCYEEKPKRCSNCEVKVDTCTCGNCKCKNCKDCVNCDKECGGCSTSEIVDKFKANYTAHVLAIGDDWTLLTLAQLYDGDGSDGAQRGTTVVKVKTCVKLSVLKNSTTTINDGTQNNNCYAPLSDSIYSVYKDEAMTDYVGQVKGDGVDYIYVPRGTYYIKETTAPKGYYIDTEVHVETIMENTVYEYEDVPMQDPFAITVQKAIPGREFAGDTTGDVPIFKGIEFDVYYFKNEYTSQGAIPDVSKADEHAIFVTDEDGYLFLEDDYLVETNPKQTWKYRTVDGLMEFPLGTIMVVERNALAGMEIVNNFGMVFTITDMSDKTDDNVTPFNYHGDITPIVGDSGAKTEEDRVGGTYENYVFMGGVTVTKADYDWEKSDFQGDATLKGAVFTIYNRSENSVNYKGKIYEVDEIIGTITTEYDEALDAYVASTGNYALEYGTYEIVETTAPEGYNLADWSRTFTIREDGEMHNYTVTENNDVKNGTEWTHRWCVDRVMRGGVAFGKVDRETLQYYSLGYAQLSGATFQIINRSIHPVYVNGKTYDVDEVVMELTSDELDIITKDEDGTSNTRTIIGASTGNYVLPYGTYDIIETGTGLGYLYDTISKNQLKTFSVRYDGDMHYFIESDNAFHNQVQREDWYFQKKADDSGDEMPLVAFTVTSVTTGETHVIVTDENGKYQSNQVPHSQRTNANDPNSPFDNGSIGIDEDGNYYVKDASKLDYDAGTWFTGLAPELTNWTMRNTQYDPKTDPRELAGLGQGNNKLEDTDVRYDSKGRSYTIGDNDDIRVYVNDDLRAYPYDTYYVEELPSEANEGYNLVSFIVTLKRYNNDPDSNGIILDYGTVDDQHVDIYTSLGYKASKVSNVIKEVPVGEEVEIIDTVTYAGVTASSASAPAEYRLVGELHLVDENFHDLGVVATEEMTFTGRASGQVKMTFTLNTRELMGKTLVATEALYMGKTLLTQEVDYENTDQAVVVSENDCGCTDPDCKFKKVKDWCKQPGCCNNSDCCHDCHECKNPCGCDNKDCKHRDEMNHCINNPGCCDDFGCCDEENCSVCLPKAQNLCGCDNPDCKHKHIADHCVNNPGCCDDTGCCDEENCHVCLPGNACGCKDPNCKHKDEKDHCKKPGCCDHDDCCHECPECKHPNECGCNNPDCKHKDEKNHCVRNPGCCDDEGCCDEDNCDVCLPAAKNPCGCLNPDCKHKDEKDHCKKNPGCCDDEGCCDDDNCGVCEPGPNDCGCSDPDCKHKDEKDHCKKPGCCDDDDCCKDCDDCKPAENACGCPNPDCKHKDEKDHCKKNPGCCDDTGCCDDDNCGVCEPGNACGCDDPNCKHKDEKDHCKKPGCCDDADCCDDCDDCKAAPNACGCDNPDCKHKDEKNHCKNNPGCCDDTKCCDEKNCKVCKPANACGCDDPNCKHKDEKDHCVNNPGCCDDANCCDRCDDCKPAEKTPAASNNNKAPSSSTTTKTETPAASQGAAGSAQTTQKTDTVKTGQATPFVLLALIGLAAVAGGGFFFTKNEKGREIFKKIKEKFSK